MNLMTMMVVVLCLPLVICFLLLFSFYAKMNLFAFINHADPTKVRIGVKQIEEGQTPLLESTRGRVVPLAGVNDQGDQNDDVQDAGNQNDDVQDAGHDVNEEGAADGNENPVEAGIVRIEDEVPSTVADGLENPGHAGKSCKSFIVSYRNRTYRIIATEFAYWAPNIESMEVNSESNPLERKDAEGPSLDENLENEEHLDVDSCDSDSPKNLTMIGVAF
ncbi:hypothetical protein Tco_0537661 [Tanacetum coccineum]